MPENGPTFNEFIVRLPGDAADLIGRALERGILPGLPLGQFYPSMENSMLVAVTEKRTKDDIDLLADTVEALLCQ